MSSDPNTSLLLTDLYQLSMLRAYLEAGMTKPAAFEFFVRRLPQSRGFLMAAGLEQVIQFLEQAKFSDDELTWLTETQGFGRDFIDYLAGLRFTGSVDAMAEGRVFFPDEPILRLVAPLPEAQLFETRIVNLLHFQTVIASKAVRMVLAAPDKPLIDFGLRRAHGAEAGLLAARASFIAGFAGTATVLANRRFGIPIYGTMAHSFIQAHDSEAAAFENFASSHPGNVVLLLDTYDTATAARKAVMLANRLRTEGLAIQGVRLDSGDLAAEAKLVRGILDDGGLNDIKIFASGGIDEASLEGFVASGAPIDGFGIGTSLTTSLDAPALDCAYKLQEYDGRAKRKLSTGKATWPGRKQVYRRYATDSTMAGDVLTLERDHQDGEALLHPVMREGRRLSPAVDLADSRALAASELQQLPSNLRPLRRTGSYPVTVGSALRALTDQMDAEHSRRELAYQSGGS